MTVKILQGNAPEILQTLSEQSVHCVVTSPPYWALRSYLEADDPLKPLELGSEKTPTEHVERMVAVLREVWRVLRDDGLLWVNYGDTYNAYNGNRGDSVGIQKNSHAPLPQLPTGAGLSAPNLQPLDRVGVPERFALAMQADGWLWRDTIIWRKKSPMPASLSGTAWTRCRVKVTGQKRGTSKMNGSKETRPNLVNARGVDVASATQNAEWSDCPGCPKCESTGGYVLRRGSWRTTPAHEYIFLFAKKAGYFADQEGVKEPCAASTLERERYTRILDDPNEQYAVAHDHESISGGTRNPRSVITFKNHSLKEKHYAAFPPALAEFCIKASTSPKGVCPTCGAQWARVLETKKSFESGSGKSGNTIAGKNGEKLQGGGDTGDVRKGPVIESKTLGFRPTCSCSAGEPAPAVVLDPFGGAGTTGLVADRLGRDCILIELSPKYAAMSKRRITKDAGMFAAVE